MTKTKKITDQDRRDRIQPILDYWVPVLGLSDWQITWEISGNIPARIQGGEDEAGGTVHATGPYQHAHIRFARYTVDEHALESELETLITHELGHCVLHPLLAALAKHVGNPSSVYDAVHWEAEKVLDVWSGILMTVKYGKPLTARYSPPVRS